MGERTVLPPARKLSAIANQRCSVSAARLAAQRVVRGLGYFRECGVGRYPCGNRFMAQRRVAPSTSSTPRMASKRKCFFCERFSWRFGLGCS